MCRKNEGGCGYEYCDVCLTDWKSHGSITNNNYSCNVFGVIQNGGNGQLSDEEIAVQSAMRDLQRLEFYFVRFHSYSDSWNCAVQQRKLIGGKMLGRKERQFLLDVVTELEESWRILAWTYPLLYYSNESHYRLKLTRQQGKLEEFCNGLQATFDCHFVALDNSKSRQKLMEYTTVSLHRQSLIEVIETQS